MKNTLSKLVKFSICVSLIFFISEKSDAQVGETIASCLAFPIACAAVFTVTGVTLIIVSPPGQKAIASLVYQTEDQINRLRNAGVTVTPWRSSETVYLSQASDEDAAGQLAEEIAELGGYLDELSDLDLDRDLEPHTETDLHDLAERGVIPEEGLLEIETRGDLEVYLKNEIVAKSMALRRLDPDILIDDEVVTKLIDRGLAYDELTDDPAVETFLDLLKEIESGW